MSPHLLLRMQSDERLVALVRDGHDQAFATAVDRYQPELLRYCTRLVGASRAEDVVQQAFLNAHMALRSSDQEIQLRPWLYRIAHNAGLNVLRATRQQAELDDRLAAPGGIEQDLESRERLREALAAIARLPEPQRDALTLQAVEGRSHTEIAAAIGVTPGAARQHLHRARTTVRAAVSAITPYGLIARLAMAGTDGGAGVPIAATAGGATVAKVGAGLLAAGAIGVGATQLPVLHTHHHGRHAARVAPAAERAEAPEPAAPRATEHGVRGPAVLELRHARRHRGRGAGDGSSHEGHHHSGSGGGGEAEVEHRSSSGDDGGRSGSSGSSPGSDGHGGSSGDDGGTSTTSGSGSTSGSSSGDSGSSSGSGSDGSSGSSDDGTQLVTTTAAAPTTSSGDDGGSSGSDGGGGSDGGTSDTSGSDDGH